MNKLKYKVGDKVRIKSVDWFRNKGIFGCCMTKCYGEVVTITSGNKGFYRIKEDGGQYCWIDEMIEGLVEEETKPKYEDEVNGEYYSTPKYLVRPSGYQFVDDNGNVINATKIVLEKKKKEYPKTYEECCDVLLIPPYYNLRYHTYERGYGEFATSNELLSLQDKLNTFGKLIIYRNAYWKIAGEKMGLGKPWEPNWTKDEWSYMAYISYNGKSIDKQNGFPCCNTILTFPTIEMRDAFYENFKSEIEICKELL